MKFLLLIISPADIKADLIQRSPDKQMMH